MKAAVPTASHRRSHSGDGPRPAFPRQLRHDGPRLVVIAESPLSPGGEPRAGIRSGHAGADGGCPIGGAGWS